MFIWLHRSIKWKCSGVSSYTCFPKFSKPYLVSLETLDSPLECKINMAKHHDFVLIDSE